MASAQSPASRLWQPIPGRPLRYRQTRLGQAGCLDSVWYHRRLHRAAARDGLQGLKRHGAHFIKQGENE